MASSTPSKDMTETVCQCPVCSDQLKDPKLLPCLHRYCRDCLTSVILSTSGGMFKCSVCKQDCKIPEKGVDGFKTDLHMTSRLLLIKLQDSFVNKDQKQLCVSCSKESTMPAYCFKCDKLLCQQCFQIHLTFEMFQDHQPHTLNLETIKEKNLTWETISPFTVDPICADHVTERAQLFCSTCGGVPICVTCVTGMHKGHDLLDVVELAKSERELLEAKLLEITKNEKKLYELPTMVKAATQKLRENVKEKSEKLQIQYEHNVNKMKDKINENDTEKEAQVEDIENRREQEKCQLRVKFENEMTNLDQKYDQESQEVQAEHDKIEAKCKITLENFDRNLKELSAEKELLTRQKENELQDILEYCEQIIERYENFTATTSSILASKDDWSDSQCIPCIRTASDALVKEMEQEFPQLELLSDFTIDETKVVWGKVKIIFNREFLIDFKEFDAKQAAASKTSPAVGGYLIDSITHTSDGNMVTSGTAPDNYSHITVINSRGKIQRQEQMTRRYNSNCTIRYCCYLSEHQVVTVCAPNEIGIYDVRDGSYNRKYIDNVVTTGKRMLCVAYDPDKNRIIVCLEYSNVFLIFDHQLNYSHTVEVTGGEFGVVNDIAVHDGYLLVCHGNGAHAITMEGQSIKIVFEFTKPDLVTNERYNAIDMCIDKNGFIYMLGSCKGQAFLAQYSRDGRQLLYEQPQANVKTGCLTTLDVDGTERLAIASKIFAKLYSFRLIAEE
ncbi:uncharacterized protein [Apostichopus japonicus]|uniref:uncharacterized protein n=1 Tax=Stichopus japonicus TaxID=307972 RepID=UPI003AB26B91